MGKLYGLAYSEVASAYLENVIPARHRAQIRKKIKALASNPRPLGAKRLQDFSDQGDPVYRLRSGDYRVLYCVRDGSLVAVLDIGHRKDIYRRKG